MERLPALVARVSSDCAGLSGTYALRERLLDVLQDTIGFSGAFFATVDPTALLYTSAIRRDMPSEASPAFVQSEFGDAEDPTQIRHLARASSPVGWLDATTRGERTASLRYREAMAPFGLGDELRVLLRAEGRCWGLICLHRMQGEPAFQERYVQVLTDLSPRIGEILRRSVIAERAARDWASEGPGVVLIGASGEVESLTPQGSRWLAELAELDNPSRTGLPTVIEAMGARLASGHSTAGASFTPRARVRLRSGRWLSLHASPLGIGDVAHRSIAIVIEPASAHDLAPMMIAAYGLTNRETQVAERLIAGMPRKRVAAGLQLSLHTVNDHIKAIYEKLGISSVGQLRMQVLQDHSAVGQA